MFIFVLKNFLFFSDIFFCCFENFQLPHVVVVGAAI